MLKTAIIRVWRVHRTDVARGYTAFLIDGVLTSDSDRLVQVQTVNAWLASLCETGKRLSQPVEIRYERTAYGQTLRKARVLEAA